MNKKIFDKIYRGQIIRITYRNLGCWLYDAYDLKIEGVAEIEDYGNTRRLYINLPHHGLGYMAGYYTIAIYDSIKDSIEVLDKNIVDLEIVQDSNHKKVEMSDDRIIDYKFICKKENKSIQ